MRRRAGWQAEDMRLRNPGGAEKALETVRKVRNELGNADGRKDAFLSWCDHWASPQLGNRFQATDELFAEIAECCHRLVLLPGMPAGQLNGLMQRECRAWDGRLERLEADLAELIRFLGRAGRVVVLDTSALMEGVFFTEFDWHGPIGPCGNSPSAWSCCRW
jgi:hypothetical protein